MRDLNLPHNVSPAGAETKQIELNGRYSVGLVSDSPNQEESKPLDIG
jgi:hypothetical protein